MTVPPLVDTHAHFDHLESEDRVREVISRASEAGVRWIVAVGGSNQGNWLAVNLARRYPDFIRAAVGYDREHAGKSVDLAELSDLAGKATVVAVGEIGLDYYYSRETRSAQWALMEEMLSLAVKIRKPVIVHSREAEGDTIQILRAHGAGSELQGVVHCFTGRQSFAESLLECGFYIGLSGILTFPRANELRAVASSLPLDRILLETDSPYLAPVPVRGAVNEPANVVHVARVLAKIRNDSFEHIAHITTENAFRLFGKPLG